MKKQLEQIKEFHAKHGIETASTPLRDFVLSAIGRNLKRQSKNIGPTAKLRPPMFRLSLMLEELAEFAGAAGEVDEVEMLDALTDLLYVVLGTAVQLDLPIAEAFEAVHKSNMTKDGAVRSEDRGEIRDKGANYVPANLTAILEAHRAS